MNLEDWRQGFANQHRKEPMSTLESIKKEFAHLLWADCWYSALEEDDEYKTPEQAADDARMQSACSGNEISDLAPEVPQSATDFAEKYFEEAGVDRVNELLVWIDKEELSIKEIKRLADCLYHEAVGNGVSWADDYKSVHPWQDTYGVDGKRRKPCGYIEVYAFRQADGSWMVEGSL